MQRIEITLRGVTPLLMNRLSDEILLALHMKDKRKFSAPRLPRDEAERKLYRQEDGQPYVPVENLMACFIAAGVFIRLDGTRQLSTNGSTLLPSFLSIENRFCPVLNACGDPASWEVDMRQGRNPNGGEAVCIIRPRFDEWSLRLSVLAALDSIPESTIRQLVDIAGANIGLCDFRPQRRGIFGTFRVDAWRPRE